MTLSGKPTPIDGEWWQRAVVYQVYIRSFRDGDGDGVGDIEGIRASLPYLSDLGVDAIWITPWYPSPMVDAGYDVADYRDIDPLFGTLDAATHLIDQAHRHGLRVMVDLVPNHTSDEHAWFREALAASPASAARARYIFREGRGTNGSEPPNDWRSCFGGAAWTCVTEHDGSPGQWFLHLFAREQPDLDWTSSDVRTEFLDVLTFWVARGVDGFRIDVAHGLAKADGLPDVGYDTLELGPNEIAETKHVADHPHWDRDEVHGVYRSWRLHLAREQQVAFVGEAVVESIERMARYVRPGELHSTFNFAFMRAPWDAPALAAVIDETIREFAAVGAAPTWALGNHDVVRIATRFADGTTQERGRARALAGALLILGLPGGAYIYQGDELGLPEVDTLSPHERRDPLFLRTDGDVIGRDGCRVPLPWSAASSSHGFSPAEAMADPWLPQPPRWGDLSVERQDGAVGSALSVHRAALRIRRSHPGLVDQAFLWLDGPQSGLLHFARGVTVCVLVNAGDDSASLPPGARVMLSSGPLIDDRVPPDTACWYEATSADHGSGQQ